MEKEEILKLSKVENKLQDERGKQFETKCYANAFYMINVICGMLWIIMDWFFKDEFMIQFGTASVNLGIIFLFPTVCGTGSYYMFRFYYFRKWKDLFLAILFQGIFIACVIKMFLSVFLPG